MESNAHIQSPQDTPMSIRKQKIKESLTKLTTNSNLNPSSLGFKEKL